MSREIEKDLYYQLNLDQIGKLERHLPRKSRRLNHQSRRAIRLSERERQRKESH